MNADVLAGILHDYQIRIALNGPKALKIAQSDPAPAFLLLDVMMREMDALQANERTRRIPAIFVTAKSEDEDEALSEQTATVEDRGACIGTESTIRRGTLPRRSVPSELNERASCTLPECTAEILPSYRPGTSCSLSRPQNADALGNRLYSQTCWEEGIA